MQATTRTVGSHRLAREVTRRGLSQTAAAELINVKQQHFGRLLLGHRKPGLKTALLISSVFGVDPSLWARSLPPKQAAQ